jgi:hypothetical protein
MIEFSVYIKDVGKDILEFEVHNQKDERALRLRFDPDLEGLNFDIGDVEPWPVPIQINKWYDVKLSIDCNKSKYDAWLNGEKVREGMELEIETETLERMIFRTGSWRSDVRQFILKGQPHGPGMDEEDLHAAGIKAAKSEIWIDNVRTSTL